MTAASAVAPMPALTLALNATSVLAGITALILVLKTGLREIPTLAMQQNWVWSP